ncbi:p-aminobenzoyl-glutamate transport protein [Arthrobacter saudimassiliensis]|uniref:p-aminobenzoyl-glutamate transport protein n=1 Tax=Arthrobacter saudimassiliensis TaxID=1461584 RepID=A0A078MVF3_9MICC|nr:p-aminobenzoyl-glutamate transport protein [Arthrobacter saudimassiliensis]
MAQTATAGQSRALRGAFRVFSAIERVGNMLPHPFWLFCILGVFVVLLSAALEAAGVSALKPGSDEAVAVRSLLSPEGIQVILGDAVENFASFPPLASILTTMLGIAVAEKSGLIDTVLRNTVTRVPTKYVTFALAMAAMIGHVAGDAAYVTLIPLGALVFKAVGKPPMLGAIVAFVSISAGYDASPSVTTTDVLLSGITTAAAATIDPDVMVSPLSNYFFSLASSVVVALVITIVVEKVLSKRPDLASDDDAEDDGASLADLRIGARERRALRAAGIAAVAFIALAVGVLVPESSPFRGEEGSILKSPVLGGMAFVIGLFFIVTGWLYGRMAGTFRSASDVLAGMVDGFRSMAPILVLFFAISQFIAYFKWSGMGEVLAISGAHTLDDINAPGWAILLGIAVLISVMNFIITSGSAMWSLAAPVFVPMLMLLDIDPATTQAMYRVADSVTNCVTPMSPYFVMALGFVQKYRKDAGIGTLASFTIPLAAVVWVVWIALFMVWYAAGIPFGI